MFGNSPGYRPGGRPHGPPPPPPPPEEQLLPANTPIPIYQQIPLNQQNPHMLIQSLALLAANQVIQTLNGSLQTPNFSNHAPNYSLQNPNFSNHAPNYSLQNPNSSNPAPNFQAPNFHPLPELNQGPRPQQSGCDVERIDAAVKKARSDLVAEKESVSAWKVSQSTLLILQAESWESLGLQMQQVPSLNLLIATECKINAFIHCFAAAQRVTSLYDLEVAICKNEGIHQFKELEMGPLLRHPLVIRYFCVDSDVTEVYKITSTDILSYLCKFMDSHEGKEISIEEFMEFVAKKRSAKSKRKLGVRKLGVRIQNLGTLVTYIQEARRSESCTIKKVLDTSEQKSIKDHQKRPPLAFLQKEKLDDCHSSIPERAKKKSSKNGPSGNKHVRFISPESEDHAADGSEDEVNENEEKTRNHCVSQDTVSGDRVSRCPYPSADEELSRVRLRRKTEDKASPHSGSGKHKEKTGLLKKRGKPEPSSSKTTAPRKLHKKSKNESDHMTEVKTKRSSTQNEAKNESDPMTEVKTKRSSTRNEAKVVSREVIYQDVVDSRSKAALINWVLPYAQRYMYKIHCDAYAQLKKSGFENLNNLHIVVVEELFYRKIIKGRESKSKKKHRECSCLLEGNVLYATQDSDSHALFMELTRLLFDGTRDLHMANFLHMITIMAELGSNQEQTEHFVLNSQKIPELPDEEPIWSLPSVPSSTRLKKPNAPTCIGELNPSERKLTPEDRITKTTHMIPKEMNAYWDIEGNGAAMAVPLPDGADVAYDGHDLVGRSEDPNLCSFNANEGGGQVSSGMSHLLQAKLTGRLGEHIAYNYFMNNFGTANVSWVNQEEESGLPYDLVVGDEGSGGREYVEVKATKYGGKDWFTITVKEWQFSVEKGESFSIAHVHLYADNMSRITVYKNPAKLCLLGRLKLAILIPKQ